jgi:hypothetical protein
MVFEEAGHQPVTCLRAIKLQTRVSLQSTVQALKTPTITFKKNIKPMFNHILLVIFLGMAVALLIWKRQRK